MNVEKLIETFNKNNINSFFGVPDSLLKDLCSYIEDNSNKLNHTITANEGNAIAMACGHYLATNNPAVVYMQNSGIGNCVNPLLSLVDEEVYNIPLLMIIGMRGEVGVKDEPQHIKQGRVTSDLLKAMEIEHSFLPFEDKEAQDKIQKVIEYIKATKKPYAILVKKNTFEKYEKLNKYQNNYIMTRQEAIETIVKKTNNRDIFVSSTGYISRELYETREKLNQNHTQDFLTVGSMGHANSIALAIAQEKKDRNIYCLDGDGAILMHMGAIPVIASKKLDNFKHIILNNEAHDSVGAQPTVAKTTDFCKMALSCGYKEAYCVDNLDDLNKVLDTFTSKKGTQLLEIKVKCGAKADLSRPKEKPTENKEIFMNHLKN